MRTQFGINHKAGGGGNAKSRGVSCRCRRIKRSAILDTFYNTHSLGIAIKLQPPPAKERSEMMTIEERVEGITNAIHQLRVLGVSKNRLLQVIQFRDGLMQGREPTEADYQIDETLRRVP